MRRGPIWLISLVLWTTLVSGLFACQLVESRPSPTPQPTDRPLPSPTPTPSPASPAGFEQFLTQVNAARFADRRFLVSDYLARIPAAPLTDADQAVFVWRGVARSVQLVGDMNNWGASGAMALQRIEETELWWYRAPLETTARLDYLLEVDGERRLDPLNPRTLPGSVGSVSELAMPGYELPPEVRDSADTYPSGVITEHILNSQALGQRRTIFVYNPPGQLVGARLPSLYIQDGGDYLSLIDAPRILDRLIARQDIPPLIAVFIPPIQRQTEYNRSDAYTRFMVDELVPFIQATYQTDPDPAQTGTLGAALGGLMALHLSLSQPDVFGLAASQSGLVGTDNDGLARGVAVRPPSSLQIHLTVGLYETAVGPDGQNVLESNRRLAAILQANGYAVAYVEQPAGHSWGLWRDDLGAALRFLYGR